MKVARPDRMPPARYLTEREVADQFRVSDRTVRRWRAAGYLRIVRLPGGPAGLGRVRYLAGDVSALEQRIRSGFSV
jgi:predicted site-specific integrase-resolvase